MKREENLPGPREDFLSVLHELSRAYQAYMSRGGGHVRSLGLTYPQFDVLATLGFDDGVTLGCIAEKTLITKSSLTGIVDRLEKKGLVERRTSERDRRCVLAHLTPQGRALFDEVYPKHVAFMESCFEGITEADQAVIKGALSRLRTTLEACEPAP